jgi:signal transduction histidine kinase
VVFWKYPRAVPLMVELPLIVIPFLLWAAFRFEPRTVVLICFSLAYVAVAATGMGRGFYSVAGVDAALRVLALQAYLFTVFVSVMFTSAALKDAEHGRTERRRLERWLEQADRLRLAGQLASGVAHDFNNYLAVIQGYAEILSEDSVPAARREEAIRIRDAAQRCSTLARQLQSLGREQEEATGPLDLNAVVRQCEPFLAQTMGGARRLRTGLAPGALSLVGHAPQVEEVLLNLVANARDAMPRAGVCVVETGHRLLDSRDAAQFLEGREGRYVMLGVRDEGTGMDEETRRHLFDPFFTTKGENGTGLGMAMVYDIVRKHGGCIQVESAVGRGTTVTVLFPAVSSI